MKVKVVLRGTLSWAVLCRGLVRYHPTKSLECVGGDRGLSKNKGLSSHNNTKQSECTPSFGGSKLCFSTISYQYV